MPIHAIEPAAPIQTHAVAEPVVPVAGMTISVHTRRDVTVVDPERFLAAARQALRGQEPGLTDAEAAERVTDVTTAFQSMAAEGRRCSTPIRTLLSQAVPSGRRARPGWRGAGVIMEDAQVTPTKGPPA